jgi:hypothetical protein
MSRHAVILHVRSKPPRSARGRAQLEAFEHEPKPALEPDAEGQLTLPRHLEGLARPGPLDANEGVRDEERAPQVDLHGITDRYGMRTANFVAMHLEYPTPSASQ